MLKIKMNLIQLANYMLHIIKVVRIENGMEIEIML